MATNSPKSFRAFVLQHTTPDNLNKAKRFWITKLQTQINNLNSDNLNFMPKLFISRQLKKQMVQKINQSHNLHQIFASRNFAQRIFFLNQIPDKQKHLTSLHPKALRKILSMFTNKTIIPVIPRRLTKPTIYLQYSLPPNFTITKQYKSIIQTLSKPQIKDLTILITSTLHQKLSPTIKKQKIKIPIPTTFVSTHLNRKTLKTVFIKAQSLLPNCVKNKIDTAIVYKNLDTLGTLFFNYKTTATTPANTNTVPTCLCHNPQFKTFLNKHGHIDKQHTHSTFS
jgi:hypothetical protein